MPQGDCLCNYLKQEKYHFFVFYKIGEQEGGTGPASRGLEPLVGGGDGESV
jgi:hypothetical protein